MKVGGGYIKNKATYSKIKRDMEQRETLNFIGISAKVFKFIQTYVK